MSASQNVAERKAAVLANLRAGRDLVVDAMNDAKLDEIYQASQWGVVDAVNHMVGGLPYRAMVDRTLREDRPQFPAWPSPVESWDQLKAKMIASMDESIRFVEGLTESDLNRVALCGTDEVPVIQFLEWASDHYLEHGRQIKNEILPLALKA
jgi:hypothetical protein